MLYFRLSCLVFIFSFSASGAQEDVRLERMCYSDEYRSDGASRKTCQCNSENESQLGLPTLEIDCSFKNLKSDDIPVNELPLYSVSLDLSWNKLEFVPDFESDSLKVLMLMHNNISELVEKNFQHLSTLRELYLSWNAIQTVSINAFSGLSYVQVLDLSHNNLKTIAFNVFSHLRTLDRLDLSWNRKLNNTNGIQELDFYSQFGVNPKLSSLKIDRCGLREIHLPERAPLTVLSLRDNEFNTISLTLPSGLKELDISNNPLQSLLPNYTVNLLQLERLYVEDMPTLRSVENNALGHLTNLKTLSFQNSRRLTSFHEFAFGTQFENINLEVLSFRGCALRTFNQTVLPVFKKLKELDLNGMPLRCDCELVWVKELKIETNGRCISPSSLRGMRLTNVRSEDFSCDRWPRWVYGVLILLLLLLCIAGICLVVTGLQLHRGVTMRKVGSNSPYARVTIEPNRSESGYY